MMATITRDGELTAPFGFTVTLRGEEAGSAMEFPVGGLISTRPLYAREVYFVDRIRLSRGAVVAIEQDGVWMDTPPGTALEVVECESNVRPATTYDD